MRPRTSAATPSARSREPCSSTGTIPWHLRNRFTDGEDRTLHGVLLAGLGAAHRVLVRAGALHAWLGGRPGMAALSRDVYGHVGLSALHARQGEAMGRAGTGRTG